MLVCVMSLRVRGKGRIIWLSRGGAMKDKIRYSYEKRIAELVRENSRLQAYRLALINIFDGAAEAADSSNGISKKWLFQQMRGLVTSCLP